MRFATHIAIVCMLMMACNCSPARYTLYMGPSGYAVFDTGLISRHPADNDNDFISFLEYESCGHRWLDNNSEKQENRMGLILPEKDTQFVNSIEEAYFGNSDDTCRMGFSFKKTVVHIGRSATTSVFNIIRVFSGEPTHKQQPY